MWPHTYHDNTPSLPLRLRLSIHTGAVAFWLKKTNKDMVEKWFINTEFNYMSDSEDEEELGELSVDMPW